MFMNYAKLLLSPLIFISSCLSAYELQLLNQKKINQQAQAIEAKVTRDYYLRVAMISIVAARLAYLGINYLNSHDQNPISSLSPQPNNIIPPIAVPEISWVEWADKVKMSWLNWAKHVISTENI